MPLQMVGGQKWLIYDKILKHKRHEMPTVFTSLSEARYWLVFHWHTCSFGLDNLPSHDDPHFSQTLTGWKHNSISIFHRWSAALDSFLENRGESLSPEEVNGLRILQIQSHVAFTSLRLTRAIPTAGEDDQTFWDEFIPMYGKIISLAADVIQSDLGESPKPSFSTDLGVIGPIFEVISRCRDPVIRRRGVELLKSAHRQEGVWNSFLVGKVAERLVEIEEEGLGEVKSCQDVPDWARISGIHPVFDPVGRRANLLYSRYGSKNYLQRRTIQEVMEW
jgi:hypothetical protein